MTKNENLRLCGGTFFTLLLEARKQLLGANEHYAGKKDGLTEYETLIGLARVIRSDLATPMPTEIKTIQGNASEYKKCKNAGGGYFPFGDKTALRVFDERVKNEYVDTLRKMCRFVDDFIDAGGDIKKDELESFDEMYNLLAAILSKGIGLQLKQGLYREYISRQEELSVMRGKINMPGTIKNRLAHKRVLTCDFDELSENNLLIQILKTTVTLLLRNGKVQAKYKDDLKKKMLYFSNVEIIEPTGIKWSSIRFQRNNQTYRMLVAS